VAAVANVSYPGQEVLQLGVNSYPLVFHVRSTVREVDLETVRRQATEAPVLVYTAETAIPQLESSGLTVEVAGAFEHYRITRLSGRFLDHRQRASQVQPRVLLLVSPAPS
jgi:hypothetical protein